MYIRMYTIHIHYIHICIQLHTYVCMISVDIYFISIVISQANSLHWTCLTSLPRIYDTPLWKCISKTLDIIAESARVSVLCLCLGSVVRHT